MCVCVCVRDSNNNRKLCIAKRNTKQRIDFRNGDDGDFDEIEFMMRSVFTLSQRILFGARSNIRARISDCVFFFFSFGTVAIPMESVLRRGELLFFSIQANQLLANVCDAGIKCSCSFNKFVVAAR